VLRFAKGVRLDANVAGGGAAKAQLHIFDQRLEASDIEAGLKQCATGDFHEGKERAGIHAAEVVFFAGKWHAQTYQLRFEHFGLEIAALDEGNLFLLSCLATSAQTGMRGAYYGSPSSLVVELRGNDQAAHRC
jgi:hypothetical protein